MPYCRFSPSAMRPYIPPRIRPFNTTSNICQQNPRRPAGGQSPSGPSFNRLLGPFRLREQRRLRVLLVGGEDADHLAALPLAHRPGTGVQLVLPGYVAPERIFAAFRHLVADLLAIDLTDLLDRLLHDLKAGVDLNRARLRLLVVHGFHRFGVVLVARRRGILSAIGKDAFDLVGAELIPIAREDAPDADIEYVRAETELLRLPGHHEGVRRVAEREESIRIGRHDLAEQRLQIRNVGGIALVEDEIQTGFRGELGEGVGHFDAKLNADIGRSDAPLDLSIFFELDEPVDHRLDRFVRLR